MILNEEEKKKPSEHVLNFRLSESFTYLGIKIVPQLDQIMTANYKPILDSVSKSIERWMSLPISLIGRINILKMNILPKFIHLFQNIPLAPPVYLFPKIKKILINFIRNKRHPRLRPSLIYLPFDRGGLQCPNLQWYYWAAQIENHNVLFFRKFSIMDGSGVKFCPITIALIPTLS